MNRAVLSFRSSLTIQTTYSITCRTQHIVDEALQIFVQESNISILQHSSVIKSKPTEINDVTEAGSSSAVSDSAAADAHVLAESDALTRKRESTLLNSALRVELHREANFYLSTMDGIIEGGKHFLPGKDRFTDFTRIVTIIQLHLMNFL